MVFYMNLDEYYNLEMYNKFLEIDSSDLSIYVKLKRFCAHGVYCVGIPLNADFYDWPILSPQYKDEYTYKLAYIPDNINRYGYLNFFNYLSQACTELIDFSELYSFDEDNDDIFEYAYMENIELEFINVFNADGKAIYTISLTPTQIMTIFWEVIREKRSDGFEYET